VKRATLATPAEVTIGADGLTMKPAEQKPSPVDAEEARAASSPSSSTK
jgi:hypothetical protein